MATASQNVSTSPEPTGMPALRRTTPNAVSDATYSRAGRVTWSAIDRAPVERSQHGLHVVVVLDHRSQGVPDGLLVRIVDTEHRHRLHPVEGLRHPGRLVQLER